MDIVSVQGVPFLACLVMLAMLGYIGIHVLKREVIFIDIALAQIAAVGAIASHVIFHLHEGSVYTHALSLGVTLVAAAFFAVVRRRILEIPLEAVIGVSYAVSAAAALFIVGISPGGHVHIQEMLAGSILWATWGDVLWSAAVFAAIGFCFYLFRAPFRTISENYEGALAKGYNTLAWDFLFYALLGVVITTAVRIAGVVVVFAFLIIPATLSAVFASGWTARLFVAWVAGALSSAVGLLFAARYDFSVGPAIALFLGVALVSIGLLRLARATRPAAAAIWFAAALILGIWFGAGARGQAGSYPSGSPVHAGSGEPGVEDASSHSQVGHHESSDLGATGEELDVSVESLAEIDDVGALRELYETIVDAEGRSLVISRVIDLDQRSGIQLAIEFLRQDPPLLFRMTVVERLEESTGFEIPYDIEKPFDSPDNRKALSLLEETRARIE